MIVPIMSLGGKGVISVVANVLPEETHQICRDYLDGNVDAARKAQLDLLDLINKLFIEVNPIPVKTAMNMMGFKAGNLRLPLTEMDPANKEALRQAMINAGIQLA